jgi:hypothetical protein
VDSFNFNRHAWAVDEHPAQVDDVMRAGMWRSGSPTPDDSKRIRVNGGAMLDSLTA